MTYIDIPFEKSTRPREENWSLICELTMNQLLNLALLSGSRQEVLYVNPPDATLWEVIYPLFGGTQTLSTTKLESITKLDAIKKYKLDEVYALWKSVFTKSIQLTTPNQNYIPLPMDNLVGELVNNEDGDVVGDDVEQLIRKLTRTQLILFRSDDVGSGYLYINPPDATFWEETYQSDVGHGRGASNLSRMTFEQADEKYKLSTIYALLKKVFDEGNSPIN